MKLFYGLISLFVPFYAQAMIVSNDIFDADFCRNGYPSTWGGACVCKNPTEYTGRYCDIYMKEICQKNSDCGTEYFCITDENIGKCAPLMARGAVTSEKGMFVLSDMVLNYQSAQSFCTGLGESYRSVVRSDFDCADIGPSCLEAQMIIELQEGFGTRGFFWLDAKDSLNAYYADINDGTVYETRQDNFKTMQALCIKGK